METVLVKREEVRRYIVDVLKWNTQHLTANTSFHNNRNIKIQAKETCG